MTESTAGRSIGPYELVELIDDSGSAMVYKGFQSAMSRYVAVKVLKPHVTREIEITFPGSLVVSLCANPTTGFVWEEVKIEDESIIYQTECNLVPPEAIGVVGGSGKEVWSFNSGGSGRSTLIFEYSKPWEGGEKDEWTLGLTVVVK